MASTYNFTAIPTTKSGFLSFSAPVDQNTIRFIQYYTNQATQPSIKFRFYKNGATTPYYQMDLLLVKILTHNEMVSGYKTGLTQTYELKPDKIRWFDPINNLEMESYYSLLVFDNLQKFLPLRKEFFCL